MKEEEAGSKSKASSIRTLIIVALLIVIFFVFVSKEMETVREFIRRSGWVGMVMSVALYGMLGASPIPSEPLTVFISTIYGPFTATIVAGVGNTLAALIEYYVGGHIGSVASFVKRKESLPLGLGKLPVNSWIFLIVARMLPGYGPKFVSLLAGLYRVPVLRYLWTTAIPTFIGAAIFAYGGFGLFNLRKMTIH